jgi:predicted amidohydrolase YtcJ
VMKLAGERTRIIDLKGRRVLPGLIDSHLHIIRDGRAQAPSGDHAAAAMGAGGWGLY